MKCHERQCWSKTKIHNLFFKKMFGGGKLCYFVTTQTHQPNFSQWITKQGCQFITTKIHFVDKWIIYSKVPFTKKLNLTNKKKTGVSQSLENMMIKYLLQCKHSLNSFLEELWRIISSLISLIAFIGNWKWLKKNNKNK